MTDDTKSDKNMHKSGWMVPPRPNVPREIEEARLIAIRHLSQGFLSV